MEEKEIMVQITIADTGISPKFGLTVKKILN